jgi:hypothetical protein
MTSLRTLAALAIALVALAQPAVAQTLEENRYAGELKACAQRPEAERKACEDAVRAKIRAEHARRIEAESRRRQSR